jgi:hypothetical protein
MVHDINAQAKVPTNTAFANIEFEAIKPYHTTSNGYTWRRWENDVPIWSNGEHAITNVSDAAKIFKWGKSLKAAMLEEVRTRAQQCVVRRSKPARRSVSSNEGSVFTQQEAASVPLMRGEVVPQDSAARADALFNMFRLQRSDDAKDPIPRQYRTQKARWNQSVEKSRSRNMSGNGDPVYERYHYERFVKKQQRQSKQQIVKVSAFSRQFVGRKVAKGRMSSEKAQRVFTVGENFKISEATPC